ncbi:uncharacterized protein LOC125315334 [Rhodamnia argentea]|uniref:Uncharacterized protein LOC125315334 n=1 Tax=Rhodamnia argentea TaxID=178133 RepID=A0ABM3HGM5_9MYRT|nr:uncharacterized protein LOC125315334 [Rhodamnia argentea]
MRLCRRKYGFNISRLSYKDLVKAIDEQGKCTVEEVYYQIPGKSLRDGVRHVFDDNGLRDIVYQHLHGHEIFPYVECNGNGHQETLLEARNESEVADDACHGDPRGREAEPFHIAHVLELCAQARKKPAYWDVDDEDDEDDETLVHTFCTSDVDDEDMQLTRARVRKYHEKIKQPFRELNEAISINRNDRPPTSLDGDDGEYDECDDSSSEDEDDDVAVQPQRKTKFPFYDASSASPVLCVSMKFDDVKQFRDAIIRSLREEHTCSIAFDNNRVTSVWLAKHFFSTIKAMPNIKGPHPKQLVREQIGVNVSSSQCKRAKYKVMRTLMGTYKEEYAQIWEYARECKYRNPPSRIHVEVVEKPLLSDGTQFNRMYVCFEACRKGFLAGCGKVIGFEVLAAIARDGNNQMFPTAWAVVKILTGAYTCLFNVWGLVPAIADLMPYLEHGMCARHIYANWAKKYKGEQLREVPKNPTQAAGVGERTAESNDAGQSARTNRYKGSKFG